MGKQYISVEEFLEKYNIKESTLKRRYHEIPGITKSNEGYLILSGTRYPCNANAYRKVDNSAKKRYVLLKAISEYKYISHKELKVEHQQFVDMLKDLLSAGLIQPNHLSNQYGANAYDCSMKGDELLNKNPKRAVSELTEIIKDVVLIAEPIISLIFMACN